jgi:hypothetical protein
MRIYRQLDKLPSALLRGVSRRSMSFLWQSLLLLVALGHTVYAVAAPVSSCGTVGSDTRMQQDFIQHPLNRLEPALPFGIDPRSLPVTIAMRLLVDRTGEVVQACILFASQPASHNMQLLEEAATTAVMKWKYPKDFGLHGKGEVHLSDKYLAGTMIFRFMPPAAKSK